MNIIFKKIILQFSKFLPHRVKGIFLYPRLHKVDLIQLILLEIKINFKSNKSSLFKTVAVLKFYGLDLSAMKESVLYDIFTLLYSHDALPVLELELLHDSIVNMDHVILKSNAWITLYEIFCAKGLYYVGIACRNHAWVIYYKDVTLDDSDFDMYFSTGVLLEGGTNSRKGELIYNNLYKKGDVEFKKQANIFLPLLSNNDLVGVNYQNLDSKFYSLIRGKSIAIVGPLNAIEKDADEIDGFDLVVRLNYTRQGKGCDKVFKGVKTDIAYFNIEHANSFNSKNKVLAFETLSYSCFKGKNMFSFIKERGKNTKYREMLNFDYFLWHGAFNLIPLVLMDILAHRPKKIKIFHSDLMLTSSRYKGYHSNLLSNHERNNETFRISTIVHDPVSQYKLLKKMHDHHKFSGDSGFEKVMAMGEIVYIKELQKEYYN
jgi:hypothetical protein